MVGDRIEQALSSVGITSDRVSQWLGVPCNCAARRDKINSLDAWARRIISGKVDNAREYLGRLLGEK